MRKYLCMWATMMMCGLMVTTSCKHDMSDYVKNVGTELKVHGVFDTCVAGFNSPDSKQDPRAVSKLVINKVSSICSEIIDVMGSEGKAL